MRGYALTLTEAAEALEDRQLTSLELAEAQLTRVRATDAAVCAWETLDPEHVRREAARWDATRQPGALGGVGIGVKDIIDTADLPTTIGSPIFADRRPAHDAACVTRLRAAGAFVFGKTVTTPFAFMDPGKTRNPWDPAHTPGGSSSGSAAAVAVGHVAAAIGTQTNGSVIRPAAFCGVVGFKPTLHAIPTAGVQPFSETFDTVGTFTRTVEDAARLASALADPGRIAGTLTPLGRPPRFAYLGGFPWTVQDCDADDVVEAAVTQLRMRAEVVPIDIPPAWHEAKSIMRTIMLFEAARNLGDLQSRERARLSPAVNAGLDEGRAIGEPPMPLRVRSASGPSRSSRIGSKVSTRCWRRRRQVRRPGVSRRPATRRAARCGRCWVSRPSPCRWDSRSGCPWGCSWRDPPVATIPCSPWPRGAAPACRFADSCKPIVPVPR